MINHFRVPYDKDVSLKDYDPENTLNYTSADDAREDFKELNLRMIELQELLYAGRKQSLLIIFQAMDAGGKDGTIKHVMRGINPQGCVVTCFKAPTAEELSHDFLWRVHQRVPAKGYIGIFNRSHYEDVLITRVHRRIDEAQAKRRFRQINDFEELLADNDTVIIKFFLNISKKEQRERLQERLNDTAKWWKFDPNDLKEREHWNDYMRMYEDVFRHCNKKHAPWFIIPSNKKWFRNLAVAKIIVETLEGMNMKYPQPSFDINAIPEIPK